MSLVQKMFDSFKPLILRRNIDPYIIKGLWRAAPVTFFTIFYYSWVDYNSTQQSNAKLYDLQIVEKIIDPLTVTQTLASSSLDKQNNQSKEEQSNKMLSLPTAGLSIDIFKLAANQFKSSQKQTEIKRII